MANKAEFGMSVLRVTQGPNGKTSHKGREAIDFGGANYGAAGSVDKWYAKGCSWVVKAVEAAGDHFVYFQTTQPVQWAAGFIDYAVLALCHQDVLTQKVGQVFNPGDLMYKEGTFSGGRKGAVDPHIHSQVGRGKYVGGYLPKSQSYRMPNEAKLQDLFCVPDSVAISASGGVSWKRSSSIKAIAPTTNKEDNDVKIKILVPQAKTPSSQLLKEGWILTGDGKLYNPAGEARIVKQYDTNLSKVYEAMKGELQPGEILIATDD